MERNRNFNIVSIVTASALGMIDIAAVNNDHVNNHTYGTFQLCFVYVQYILCFRSFETSRLKFHT